MSFTDSLSVAVSHMQDWDVPEGLLPTAISNEACMLSGLDSDHIGGWNWD
jgi:hypothetical protein